MVDVAVVTGVGGMGVACARRLGGGRHLVLADFDEAKLQGVVDELTGDGMTVVGQRVDVSDRASVDELVRVVRELGPLRALVHTAGLSPTQATAHRVLEVDMLGTDHVLNAFLDVVVDGTAAVCIASMAGFRMPRPEPIGAPSGMMATQPLSSSRLAPTGSSAQ